MINKKVLWLAVTAFAMSTIQGNAISLGYADENVGEKVEKEAKDVKKKKKTEEVLQIRKDEEKSRRRERER